MGKTQILLTLSEEFKAAIGEAATKNNYTSVNEYIRAIIGAEINYDISNEATVGKRGRKPKYATEEAKQEAKITERKLKAALLDLYRHDEHVRAIVALETSLNKE